ncbi:hypothetical protein L915_06722 [Phytophthora nicotianae]|uniref:Uncharacterized protein n=1 Tax=Phytophthora nicotianae TaxID=4792 RepID=W2H3Q2_PHYNI|nr:hypothetical protein L915_06722 [Phytophthora nicotianae]
MTPHRSCMLPANFETIAFLRVNREMWNAASLIEQVITTAVHFLQFRSLLYFPRPAANYLVHVVCSVSSVGSRLVYTVFPSSPEPIPSSHIQSVSSTGACRATASRHSFQKSSCVISDLGFYHQITSRRHSLAS